MASRFLTPFTTGRSVAGFDPLMDIHREINRMFDDVWRGSGAALAGASTAPVTPPRPDVQV